MKPQSVEQARLEMVAVVGNFAIGCESDFGIGCHLDPCECEDVAAAIAAFEQAIAATAVEGLQEAEALLRRAHELLAQYGVDPRIGWANGVGPFMDDTAAYFRALASPPPSSAPTEDSDG